MKILIADDAKLIRSILKDGFELMEYEVVTASDGKEAYDKAVETSPDIIILDQMMPEVSGLECAQMLKDNDLTSKIPIVFLTAIREEKVMLEAMRLNAKGFLQKPFNIRTVIEKVEEILKG